MAMCENCNKGGFEVNEMHANANGSKLVGPCCNPPPNAEPEFVWGVSFTSRRGLEVLSSYSNITLEFKKSHGELKAWVESLR